MRSPCGWAETAAAYRLCDNPKTDAAGVLRPHHDATLGRVRAEAVVIVAQDTSELELTRTQERVGRPLNDASRPGLFLHASLALAPGRVPLGLVAAKMWSRDRDAFARSPAQERRARKAKPIEGKESVRWLEGYRDTCVLADAAPATTVVAVSDSEGDIYECPQAGELGAAKYIVRACQDRTVLDAEHPLLRQTLVCQAALGTVKSRVRKRAASTGDASKKRKQAREARTAKLTVRSARVLLRGPDRPGGKRPNRYVNVVLAREERPPAGEEPIEWILWTSLPVQTFDRAARVLDYYGGRWEIEIYFRTLKSGCGIEELRFER